MAAKVTTAATDNATENGAGMIYRLIPAVMKSIGVIGKDRQSGAEAGSRAPKYAFRGIDDMYNSIQPALIEHGVFVVPEVVSQVREQRPSRGGGVLNFAVLTVSFTFFAPDGSSFQAVTIGEAMDSSDKASNKAMSAAIKYAFVQVFCIPTEGDNDTENDHPQQEYIIPTKAEQLRDLMERVTVPPALIKTWLKKAGVDQLEKMNDDILEKCIGYVKARLPK